MTYRCGLGRGMKALTGLEEGPPHIFCDDCGLKLEARTKAGDAPMWLLNNKAPKGWLLVRHEDPESGVVLREDYCPRCRKVKEERPALDRLLLASLASRRIPPKAQGPAIGEVHSQAPEGERTMNETTFHVIVSGHRFVVEKRTGVHNELIQTPTGRTRYWKTSAAARQFIARTQARWALDGMLRNVW